MKYFVYIFLLCLCLFGYHKCTESKYPKELPESIKLETIMSACREGDFMKAYNLLDKASYSDLAFDLAMSNKDRNSLYCDIASQEAVFLMSEDNYDRIKTLYQQTYAAIGNNMNTFNEIVLGQAIIDDKYDFILEYISLASIYNQDYYKKNEKIIKSLETYFIPKNTPESNGYVLKSINNIKTKVLFERYHTLPQVGEKDYYHNKYYREFASEINAHYLEVIIKALSYKNISLANDILSFFKKDIVFDEKDVVTKIIQSNEELEARKKIQQALQSNQ